MKKKFSAKLACKIVVYLLFAVVVLTVALMLFSKMTGNIFFVGNRTTIWVMTNSMADEIPEKTYILIRKADPSEIRVGDVITFYSDDPALNGALNTHRVIEIIGDGEEFVTQGDNNLAKDRYNADGDKLVGVYEKKLTLLTALGRVLNSGTGLFLVFVIIALLVFCTYIPDLVKSYKKKKDDPNSET